MPDSPGMWTSIRMAANSSWVSHPRASRALAAPTPSWLSDSRILSRRWRACWLSSTTRMREPSAAMATHRAGLVEGAPTFEGPGHATTSYLPAPRPPDVVDRPTHRAIVEPARAGVESRAGRKHSTGSGHRGQASPGEGYEIAKRSLLCDQVRPTP